MDPIERLNSLSEEVTQTFHSDFVFLIDAEKIQHFPARNWTHDQIIEELKKRFDHSLMVKPGTNMKSFIHLNYLFLP